MVKKIPKIINKEEFNKLMDSVDKVKRIPKNTLRQYKLAILLAGEAGMRISEIVGLPGRIEPLTKEMVEPASIRLEQAKGKKDRIVPRPKRMSEKAVNMLPLTIQRRALQSFITNLGNNVLNKHITFHTLRHYFGSQCAEKMPLHQVQMLMGHSRLDTTGIYLHANPKQAIENAREVFG